MAGAKQVVVFRLLSGAANLRHEVVEIELARHPPPSLANQTVDASEAEIIPQPRAIRSVVGIAGRPMSPNTR